MILQYYRQDHMESDRILQYPRESYKIVQDPNQNLCKIVFAKCHLSHSISYSGMYIKVM